MKPPENWTQVIDRKRYSTQTATLIADDVYWDGHNMERNGRNRFLYRTPKGAYFLIAKTQWQGEQDELRPLNLIDAVALYEGPLTEHHVEYEDAFPTVTVEDA